MIYLDVVLAVPLLWGFYRGFTKGIVLEVASLAALFLGIYLSVKGCDWLSVQLKPWISVNAQYLPLISFAVIFLLVVAGIFLLAKGVQGLAKAVALGFVNKLAGACFGALKFALGLSFAIFLLNSIHSRGSFFSETSKERSFLLEPVAALAPAVMPFLKESELWKNASSPTSPEQEQAE